MTGTGMYCMKQNKMREEMKEAFINSLKEEQIPWQCDWVRMGRPENAVTGKLYRGVNSVWLAYKQDRMGYQDPRWCTFNQAQKEGWKVRKGEKGTRIEFWSLYDTETKQKISNEQAAELKGLLGDDFYDRIKPVSSVYTVFNARQIEGIPERMTGKAHPVLPEERLTEKRDVLLKNLGLSFREGGDKAFYQPGKDQITMPEMERFRSGYGYMSTFLHEAGHATGHESRLDRNIKNSFGTPDYAREELRAEIASAFTAQELGLPGTDAAFTNHKAYIQDWIMVLEKDPGELFAAIRDAEKISDYLMEKGEFAREDGKEEGKVDGHIVAEQETKISGKEEKKMETGIKMDAEIYAGQKFSDYQMQEIRKGQEAGVDVNIYARKEFNGAQMQEIRKGLESGVDINRYADTKFDYEQMEEIRIGLEKKLDVSVYDNPDLTWDQMFEIRFGLEKGLDASIYADPQYFPSQMEEIRKGLELGVDVSSYLDTDISALEMEKIRQSLEKEQDASMAKGSMTKEEVYQRMSDGEKELYDMDLDYGDVEAAGKLLEEKRQELQQRQEISRKHPDGPLFGVQEAAKIRLAARGRSVAGFQPDPVHLQVAQMIREYQDNGLEIKDIVSGKMGEIREGTGIADARYAKNLVCSIASRDIQSYEEYMGFPEREAAQGRPDRDMAAEQGLGKQEHPGDIFHGNRKTPVQGKAKQVMRGMGR